MGKFSLKIYFNHDCDDLIITEKLLLDDQPRQYWIYANNDNELATVHIKVDCE